MAKEWIQGHYPCPQCGCANDMIGRHEPCERGANWFYYHCQNCGAKADSACNPEETLRSLKDEDD